MFNGDIQNLMFAINIQITICLYGIDRYYASPHILTQYAIGTPETGKVHSIMCINNNI